MVLALQGVTQLHLLRPVEMAATELRHLFLGHPLLILAEAGVEQTGVVLPIPVVREAQGAAEEVKIAPTHR